MFKPAYASAGRTKRRVIAGSSAAGTFTALPPASRMTRTPRKEPPSRCFTRRQVPPSRGPTCSTRCASALSRRGVVRVQVGKMVMRADVRNASRHQVQPSDRMGPPDTRRCACVSETGARRTGAAVTNRSKRRCMVGRSVAPAAPAKRQNAEITRDASMVMAAATALWASACINSPRMVYTNLMSSPPVCYCLHTTLFTILHFAPPGVDASQR